MDFTYKSYKNLLDLLSAHGYQTATYHDWENRDRCVILRHDVDNDLDKAVQMARREKMWGVRSTYFVLVSSDFYNIFSKENAARLAEIEALGHEIGLHFDEMCYDEAMGCPEKAKPSIIKEMHLLSDALGHSITSVSMHRPSKEMLEADLELWGTINSYGKVFFKNFKYLSDSRRHWREPVEEIIKGDKYERLHILTHPFWYFDEERSIGATVREFVNSANRQRYSQMESNISDLASIMRREEVR